MEAWGDEEYETDPEDAPLPSMRRREASDDEDGEEAADGRGKPLRKAPSGGVLGSDAESDGQGGAQVYDDDDREEDDGEECYDEEEFGELEEGLEGEEAVVEEIDGHGVAIDESPKEARKSLESEVTRDGDRISGGDAIEREDVNQVEEQKKNEPYAVPTAGAFYMHDDRFQDNARGRRRRMFGGRKLWDPKDEHAWVHDRFEEMNLQDSRYDENNQRSRGGFRGRGSGRSQGVSRGYGRGSRHRTPHDAVNSQNQASRSLRGRGPRRYEALPKSSRDIPASRLKQPPAKSQEPLTNASSKKQFSQTADMKMDPIPQKYAFASNLNIASPPFYPSGSSNTSQDISLTQRRDAQAGNSNKNGSYSLHMEDNCQPSQSSSLLRGKTVVDPIAKESFYMNESVRPVGKTMGSAHLQPSGFFLASDNDVTSSSFRVQGTNLNTARPLNNQSLSSINHVGKVSAHIQSPTIQQDTSFQPVVRVSAQQFVQRSTTGNETSSPSPPPPPLPSANSSDVAEADSPPGSSKSRTSSAVKGKTNNHGRNSFIYSGAHVLGSTGTMGLSQGDQNFPGTPALLPVMQFGGQHPGGLGVPAVGMALPGYVAQPGFGNSEMTWVPVLAGMPGAVGTSYCQPSYIALDGNYYARQSGQTSSSASSREATTTRPATMASHSDSVVDEGGRRQNKPRSRYSEMNFGQ